MEVKASQNFYDYSSMSFQNKKDTSFDYENKYRNYTNQEPGTSKSLQNYDYKQKKENKIEVKDASRFTSLPSQTPEINTTNRQVFTKEEWEFFGYKTDLIEQQKNDSIF